MNIPIPILNHGLARGLQAIATGGNIDYIGRVFENGMVAVIAELDGMGSPSVLHEPADLNIFLDEEWTQVIVIPFETTFQAIEHLSTIFLINPTDISRSNEQ